MSIKRHMNRILRNRSGSAIIMGMILMFGVGAAGFLVMRSFEQGKELAVSRQESLELEMIAEDLKEYGKYLMFYEKVFYTKDSSGNPADPTIIDSGIKDVWKKSFGASSGNPCGGYNYKMEFTGGGKVNNKSIFCAHMFRTNQADGQLLEQGMLVQWEKNGSINKVKDGHYRFELDMSSMFTKSSFIKFDSSARVIGLIRKTPSKFKAKIFVDLYGPSSGLKTKGAERLVKISSYVELDGGRVFDGVITKTAKETVIISPNTPQNFALFMLYPSSTNFSSSINLDASDTIKGTTYYNGKMDKGIDELPTFYDTLVLSQGFNYDVVPTKATLSKLKDKFRRGVLTNLSAKRNILDSCSTGDYINNQSGLRCDWDVGDYLSFAGNKSKSENFPDDDPTCTKANINEDNEFKLSTPSCDDGWIPVTKQFLHSGFEAIKIDKAACAFISSPVEALEINAPNIHIYGTIAGGSITKTSGNAVSFYSLYNMSIHPGVPCISTDSELNDVSLNAANVNSGVKSPLVSFPSVYSPKTGFR